MIKIKKEERDNNRAPLTKKSFVEIATERKALLAMTSKVMSVHVVGHHSIFIVKLQFRK